MSHPDTVKEYEEYLNSGHVLSMPDNAGKGLTDYIAVCQCGGEWRCYYTRKGLQWQQRKAPASGCPYA